MNRLLQQFKNALSIVKQVHNDEWEFKGFYEHEHRTNFSCYTARRQGIELWLANGVFFCGVRDKPWELGPFGFIVWYGGARKRAKALEKRMKRQPTEL